VLFTLFAISTILSINPGTSYYSLFTFLTIFLIFNLSSIYLKDLTFFYKLLIIFSCIYAFILIGSNLHLINLPIKPVSDNFILQIWGHSYSADFLIFSVILIISKINPQNIIYSLPISLFLTVSLILTNSRSAIIAVVTGIIFLLPKNIFQFVIKIFLIICLVFGLIYVFRQSTGSTNYYSKTLTGSRFEYWQQALTGFQRSPLFGNGPSTFGIINQQLSADQKTTSNYVHNLILEFLTDNGIFFTFIFFLFVMLGLKTQYQKNNLLFCLCLASFINSMFDPSWSSPGIFIITLIFLFHNNSSLFSTKKIYIKINNLFLTVLSILVLIFFVSKTSSDLLYFVGSYDLSQKIDPFNLNSILKTVNTNNLITIQKIYPNETLIYKTLIEKYPLPQSEPYYYQLFKLEPLSSFNYYLKLSSYYLETNDPKTISLVSEIISKYPTIHNHRLALTLNRLALQKDPVFYYQKSIDAAPNWAPLYIDYANYLWHKNQKNEAIDILKECQKLNAPALECSQYLQSNNFKLYPAGTYPIPSPEQYDQLTPSIKTP